MRRRSIWGAAVAAAVLTVGWTFGAHMWAQETAAGNSYSIVVDVDETSVGDLRILDHSLNDGIDGDEVSPAVRKVAMAGIGEMWVALESRIDATGLLTLDDAAQVALVDGDLVDVKGKGKKFQPGAEITFQTLCKDQHCRHVPLTITVTRPDGTRVCSAFPPRHLGQLSGGKKCAVPK
jgi:hypothetical protein